MNAQHLLGTTTQGIVNNYFLNGNEDILKGAFEIRDVGVPCTHLSYPYNSLIEKLLKV